MCGCCRSSSKTLFLIALRILSLIAPNLPCTVCFPSLVLIAHPSLILEPAPCQERVTWRSATTTTSSAGGNRGTSLRCFSFEKYSQQQRQKCTCPCRTGTGSTDVISAGTAAWTLCPLTHPASSRCSRRLWREVSVRQRELEPDLYQLLS